MAATDWSREFEELQRLCESAQNDITKMFNAESIGNRDQVLQHKTQARTKLKQVGTRLPELQTQLKVGHLFVLKFDYPCAISQNFCFCLDNENGK